jgi:hypothetical protein
MSDPITFDSGLSWHTARLFHGGRALLTGLPPGDLFRLAHEDTGSHSPREELDQRVDSGSFLKKRPLPFLFPRTAPDFQTE